MNKYPKRTQNVISHYVKTLPSNVIPNFPPLFIEFLRYYFNEQIEDQTSPVNSNNGINEKSNDNSKSPTLNSRTSSHRNSNSHLNNSKRNSSNSSLNTFTHNKGNPYMSNTSIPLSRTKSIQSAYNNSINSIPSSYSESSSYYYNNHKRSLPGNLCLISKAQEFSEIQITLRELFLELYSDDLLSQYFYPIFIDFSHENIFALWLKDDEDDEYYHSTNWGINTFQTNRTNTKHTSLMNTSLGIGTNILNHPVSIGNLPIVKIGLEKQRIGVIAKNLNSFLSLLTQTSFVNNIVRNYRIGGGDESTVLSSEGSSDEEYNSIQDMMRFEEDFLDSDIASSTSSTISLDKTDQKLTEKTDEQLDSSYPDDDDDNHNSINNSDENKTNDEINNENNNNTNINDEDNNNEIEHKIKNENDSENNINENENKGINNNNHNNENNDENKDENIINKDDNEDIDENKDENIINKNDNDNNDENKNENIINKDDNEDDNKDNNKDDNENKSKDITSKENSEDNNENENENEIIIEIKNEDNKEDIKNDESTESYLNDQTESNEQFTLEINSKEDGKEEICNKDKEKNNDDKNDNSIESVKEDLNNNDEIIYIVSSNEDEHDNENQNKKKKNNSLEIEEKDKEKGDNNNDDDDDDDNDEKNEEDEDEDDKEREEDSQLESDNETLSSSITDKNNKCHRNNGFGYDSEIKVNSQKASIDVIINDNSLPNSFPYNRRFTDDYERMNKSEMNFRRYSYASSINSTLTTVSASPFAIRTMFQQQETQMSYIQWYDEVCKKENINLDNTDEIEKKLLQDDTLILSSSYSSKRSNSRKYFSVDNYQINNKSNLKRNLSANKEYIMKGNNYHQSKYNQRQASLWDSILDKNRSAHNSTNNINTLSNSNEKLNNNSNNNNNNNENNNNNNINNGNENKNDKGNNNNNNVSSNSTPSSKNELDKNRKHKMSKKSSGKLSVKSISHTLSKSAPKQIKRKIKENASLQKLKLKDNSLLATKLKPKESSGHRHSNQKNSSGLYSKKINNDMLPPPSSALSKNISSTSSSRTKISSPLSQNRNHPENYLKPRKNVPTTVTTMMTISNNTHNSSMVSKTSPKIPSKLHQNIGVNRYRTNSSPAPMYTSRSSIHRDYYIKQNMNKASTTTSNVTITTNTNRINTSTENKENSNTNTNTNNNSTNTNTNTTNNINSNTTNNKPESLQINTSVSKKESKDTIKTAPPMTTNNDNSIFNFNNLFGTKKFNKFNGFSFLTSIPIVAKLLNLDNKDNNDNNNSTNNNTEKTKEETNKSSTEDNKNNSPIDISQGITHKNLAKSPEKSTLSTYTNNSGNNINYISSSTLALQILEKERKGIPEPEQWLQKQVKARAYAIAVANAVAKRNTQNSNNYAQYTTKFTPTNHIHSFSSQRKSNTNESNNEIQTFKKETERRKFIEEDDYFIL